MLMSDLKCVFLLFKSLIKDIHESVINNNLAELEKLTSSPVPAIAVTSKDQNGATPLHKVSTF